MFLSVDEVLDYSINVTDMVRRNMNEESLQTYSDNSSEAVR